MFAVADEAARARGIRLIAPERPGYGLSDHCRHGDLRQAALDVGAVAEVYGLRRFAVIGVSGGAPFAVATALACRDRVGLLALISPVGPIADLGSRVPISIGHSLLFRVLARSSVGQRGFFVSLRYLLRRAPDTAYRWLMHRVPPSDRDLLMRPQVKASLQAAIREGLRRGVEGPVQDLRLYCAPWRLPLADLDVPAFIWQGSSDSIVPAAAAYALAGMLPSCRLEIVEGAGHYWVFGQFGRILDTVVAVMAGAGANPSS
jgi:pimeloyl-ACP methyl ester carboxylesterase